MPRRKLTSGLVLGGAVLLALIVLSLFAAPALAFPDVPSGHPYEKAINDLSSAGIIGGYTNGVFGLNDSVKRAQFAKMVVGTLDITPGTSTSTRFTDLGSPDTNGYPHKYVQAAYDNGITYGTNTAQTLFDPWRSIRRDQVVSMIVRGAKSLYPSALADPPVGTISQFDGVPEPHGANLRIAQYNGLLNGLIGMGPGWSVDATATRGEVAQMLWNLLALLRGVGPGEGDVWVYVDGSGDYPTLEAAIAAAGPGNTIYLGPGTFTLSRTLSIHSDCTLVGSGKDGPDSTTVQYGGTVMEIADSTFSAEDMRFASTTTTGAWDVMDVENAGVVLQDCSFSGANSAADSGGYGLWVGGTSTASVSDCIFTQNDADGLAIAGDSKAQLEDNVCDHNGGDGIVLWGPSSGSASGNTCHDNVYDGISVQADAHYLLQQNVCSNNGYNGMVLEGDSVVTASYNTCSSNFYDGIFCYDNANVTLEHNTCQHDGTNGITLASHASGAARYNDCSSSQTGDGIEVSDSAHGILENNTCLHNHDAGIWFGDTADGTAEGNECAFGYYGILIDAGATPIIGTNNLHDNDHDLVHL